MSHLAQQRFCKQVKKLFPAHFKRVNVIDVGSLDINGNNRYLFKRSHYIGIDLQAGKNVDVVGRAHEVMPNLTTAPGGHVEWDGTDKRIAHKFDTIISTEALEHDQYIFSTLRSVYNKLKPGGLLLITCAGDGRAEHGTTNNHPESSPFTNDYYANVSNKMFSAILPADQFSIYHLQQVNGDLQFYGIKRS